ncbi:MAG: UvrB/UvrC motif-containing protein [Bacteroidales bacterium]|nr:UvrB/UvrC motif-containing protein [Bacteroidales bacterium]
MKCQRCPKPVSFHITEVIAPNQYEEVHLCEECGRKYLNEPFPVKATPPAQAVPSIPTEHAVNDPSAKQCEVCGLKFVEFRNSGRLGCPDDYDEFREDLLPLLESIHGDTKHLGKTPRRVPKPSAKKAELSQLRKRLSRAVSDEAYEEAARLRDQIKALEDYDQHS